MYIYTDNIQQISEKYCFWISFLFNKSHGDTQYAGGRRQQAKPKIALASSSIQKNHTEFTTAHILYTKEMIIYYLIVKIK